MDDDQEVLQAGFRAALVAVLRDTLEQVPAFTIEDLLGSDEMMDELARRIMAAPLALGAPRPNLTVVPADHPSLLPPDWLSDSLAQPQHDYDNEGKVIPWDPDRA